MRCKPILSYPIESTLAQHTLKTREFGAECVHGPRGRKHLRSGGQRGRAAVQGKTRAEAQRATIIYGKEACGFLCGVGLCNNRLRCPCSSWTLNKDHLQVLVDLFCHSLACTQELQKELKRGSLKLGISE